MSQNRVIGFDDLPLEIFTNTIFQHIPLEYIFFLVLVSHSFYTKVKTISFWQDKLTKHHPKQSINLKSELGFSLFQENYSNLYSKTIFKEKIAISKIKIPIEIRILFSYAKEGNVAELIKILKFEDLFLSDFAGNRLLNCILQTKSQILLNHVFKLAKDYLEKCNNQFSRYNMADLLLNWAIICNQPLDIIKPIINDIDNPNFCLRITDLHAQPSHDTPVQLAVEVGRIDIVQYLVAKGANLNIYISHPQKKPLLVSAYDEDKIEIANWLIGQGVDVNHGLYLKPLITEIAKGRIATVEYLLAKGASATRGAIRQPAPLHMAAIKGHIDIMLLLLKKGANVNALSVRRQQSPVCSTLYYANRSTPLHYGVYENQLAVVELLLEKKANINIRNGENLTPLELAKQMNHVEIIVAIYKKILRDFIQQLNASNSPRLFGLFEYSFVEFKQAVLLLNQVVFEGADPSILNSHQHVLKGKELHGIYEGLMGQTKSAECRFD